MYVLFLKGIFIYVIILYICNFKNKKFLYRVLFNFKAGNQFATSTAKKDIEAYHSVLNRVSSLIHLSVSLERQ